jgi:hypothetical protein
MTSAVAVSALALGFTVGAFWWIQVRHGRLETYVSEVYAGYIGNGFKLRLPLTIYNTGARTLVVTDLRLVFIDQGWTARAQLFRRTVKPETHDVDDFPHPYPVAGRSTTSKFVEFGSTAWAPDVDTRYRLRVEARVGTSQQWASLTSFELDSPAADTANVFIARSRLQQEDTDQRQGQLEPD